ncbi:19888_t:CDS:2, partial [Cetraspora pellucida]
MSSLYFVEYPNHPMFKMRQSCNQLLAKEVPIKDGIFQRGFEALCRKWINRKINNNYLANIYE